MSPHDHLDSDHDDALTPAERAAFDALPRERTPGRLLEERTVRALRERGLLTEPAPRRVRLPGAWIAGAAAAAVAMFAAGMATGQWMGARSTERVVATIQQQNAQTAALMVQQTGSAYLNALSAFAQVADTAKGAQASEGREVAVQILRAAAEELVRIAPDDPVASGILAAYDRQRRRAAPGTAEGKERTVWF